MSMDFQTFGNAEFENENRFSLAFADAFIDEMKQVNTGNEALLEAL